MRTIARIIDAMGNPTVRRLAVLALLVTACAAAGCDLVRPLWYRPDDKVAAEFSQLTYPGGAPLGEDLDIVVIQKATSIELVNRTPQSYDDVMLWLNQQYAGHA